MKRPRLHHVAVTLGGLSGFFAFWEDMHKIIKGTGQSLSDLRAAGWGWWEVHSYFGFSDVVIFAAGFAACCLLLGGHRWIGYLRQSTRILQRGH